MLSELTDNPLRRGMQLEALGFFGAAIEAYQAAMARGDGDFQDAAYLLRKLIRRQLRPQHAGEPWTLVTFTELKPVQLATMLHPDAWVNFLLGLPLTNVVTVDRLTTIPAKVVLNAPPSVPEDVVISVLQRLFFEGVSTVLQTGDEWFGASPRFLHEASRYSDLTLQFLYSVHYQDLAKTVCVPCGWLGHEFPNLGSSWRIKTASERKYLWSFAGDINKSTRKDMIAAMRKHEGGFEHITGGWMTDAALGTREYRAILEDSVFVPSPPGWTCLDTCRVWEGLEAGCIPIVERRDLDYFTEICGPHPMPTVKEWSEVDAVFSAYDNPRRVEALRRECSDWWQDYKYRLRDRVAGMVAGL